MIGVSKLADYAPKGAEVENLVDSKTSKSWLECALWHGISFEIPGGT
jgi:hypothetical protein